MTRKRLNKVRDSEVTKRELLDAVGEIIRLHGFSGLKTNAIARWIGKDKNLIRYHFQGLNGLQKAFINEKDYWLPFFERFRLDEKPDMESVREMFSGLMQENFRSFYENGEMQKIILWQISEQSPLMKSISEERELAGEVLLGKTDELFRNTDVSFRAIIALLLGGSYYMSLHAHTNGSKICGIDMGSERERNEVLRTIDQVIGWACNVARDNPINENEAIDMVNQEFNRLESLAAEIAERNEKGKGQNLADEQLVTEVGVLKEFLLSKMTALNNETQVATFLKVNLARLVRICDILYSPLRLVNPDGEVLLGLIEEVRKPAADLIAGSIVLPKLFCAKEALGFTGEWLRIKAVLLESGIDPLLVEIIGIPFNRFLQLEGKTTWSDFRYLRKFGVILGECISAGSFDEIVLLEMLIGLGYNHSRFSAYYSRMLQAAISDLNPEEQRKVLLRAKARLFQVTLYTSMRFDPGKMRVENELSRWIDAELGVPFEAVFALDGEAGKLNRTQRVAELAYWEKLMYDHGFYNESNLDVFSEKIARNFNAKDGRSFTGSSIKAKLYSKDKSVIAPIAKKLREMLDDLDNFLPG